MNQELVWVDVVFQIGSKKLALKPLGTVLSFIQAARKRPSVELKVAFASGALMDAQNLFRKQRTGVLSSSKAPLWSWLQIQQHKQCLNPLEKVFSVLSLVDKTYAEVLTPDYLKSVSWMFGTLVKLYVKYHENFDILRLGLPSRSSKLCLSWCPDWTVAQSRSVLSGFVGSHELAVARFSEDMKTISFTKLL